MGRVERRVMAAIECCRTAALGRHVEACDDCLHRHVAYNSCRNRPRSILGPKCQGLARAEWLAEWQAELLPVPYFHVVFTVPAQVAAIAFHNKAVVYAILFHAAAETLKIIAGSSSNSCRRRSMKGVCASSASRPDWSRRGPSRASSRLCAR
jgi:hypothetical protein